jgi:hypothetical protein
MNSPHGTLKLWTLALLWFTGLSFIALSFVKSTPSSDFPTPAEFVMWGLSCLGVAVVWMYWDYKRRRLTPDQQVEHLLFEVARRYRRIRSLDTVVNEYRAQGASEETLAIIRSAPQILKTRAEAKIGVGIRIFVAGIIITGGVSWLSKAHYEIAIGALGGGIGLIIDGFRQRRAFRKFTS